MWPTLELHSRTQHVRIEYLLCARGLKIHSLIPHVFAENILWHFTHLFNTRLLSAYYVQRAQESFDFQYMFTEHLLCARTLF